jgi:hypothetical protein
MKPVISQLGLLALSSLTVYLLMLGITLVYAPPQWSASGMDTAQASRTLFATEPKYVFLNRSMLDSTRNKVLILGASNGVVGLKQDQLQNLVRGAEINNLSVGGSNVTQLRQIADLVHEVQGTEARRHNTFVIGSWFGLFVDDRQRWGKADRNFGDTDIDIERYRYGFFRRGAEGAVAVLPPKWLAVGVLAIHPYLVIDKMARDAKKLIRQVAADRSSDLSDAERNAITLREQDKKRYLEFWDGYMGGSSKLSDAQFRAFSELVEKIVIAGGRVVVVDLPLPPWHAQRSPYYAEYRRRTQQLFDELQSRLDIHVVSLQHDAVDDDFSDEVHPKPKVAPLWAQQLAAVLNKQFTADSFLIGNIARGCRTEACE